MNFVHPANRVERMKYLRDDFQPSVHGDSTEAIPDGMADLVMGPKLEPECEQSEHILQGALVAQGD